MIKYNQQNNQEIDVKIVESVELKLQMQHLKDFKND